jgi:hypothetical protein
MDKGKLYLPIDIMKKENIKMENFMVWGKYLMKMVIIKKDYL